MDAAVENIAITIRLPPHLKGRVSNLCSQTGLSSSHHMREALIKYLDDREDYIFAVQRLEENNASITFADLEKSLGLDS